MATALAAWLREGDEAGPAWERLDAPALRALALLGRAWRRRAAAVLASARLPVRLRLPSACGSR